LADSAGGDRALWAAAELSRLLPSGPYGDCLYQTGEDDRHGDGDGHLRPVLYVDVPPAVVIAKQSSSRTAIDPPVHRREITGLRDLANRLTG
jgi:hypothetical protein